MKALIIVDVQNDFLPGGTLAVPGGDEIIPVINRLLDCFPVVVATQDWHPADHASFAANHSGKSPGDVVEIDGLQQILWPTHCVQGCLGAELTGDLVVEKIQQVVVKGTDPRIDSYSGFFDNGHQRQTQLHELLQSLGVDQLFICGLATDYCVKFTALDAVQLGYPTFLIEDACRGVNLAASDVEQALDEMIQAGISVIKSESVRHEQSRH